MWSTPCLWSTGLNAVKAIQDRESDSFPVHSMHMRQNTCVTSNAAREESSLVYHCVTAPGHAAHLLPESFLVNLEWAIEVCHIFLSSSLYNYQVSVIGVALCSRAPGQDFGSRLKRRQDLGGDARRVRLNASESRACHVLIKLISKFSVKFKHHLMPFMTCTALLPALDNSQDPTS